jgi:hypothetical protein
MDTACSSICQDRHRSLRLRLDPALRAGPAEVPGADVGAQGGVGVGDLPSAHAARAEPTGPGPSGRGRRSPERDHVHLLIHYPPQVKLSALVGSLKGVSAHYLRKEYTDHIKRYLWDAHFWSPSYFAASAGGAPLSVIKEYIEQQKRPL